MDEIAKKKAGKAEDNRLWTAKDALKDAIERIKDIDPAKVHLCVHWRVDDEQGGHLHWSAANIQRPDHVALLELFKFQLCKEWFGYGE
jgi:hypothetical protein